MRWRGPFSWTKRWPMASRFLRDRRAATAVEFAVVLPLALLLLIGEYTLTNAMSTKRKLTITAHTIADLVARQSSSVDATTMTAILNASAQIVSPYNMTLHVGRGRRTGDEWKWQYDGDSGVRRSTARL